MNSVSRISKFGIVMCLLFLSGTNLSALEEVEFEITADYNGKYVWRGQNLDDDPAFQPGFSATYEGFTFGIWGSMETTSINNNSGEFTEVDHYIDYSADVPGVDGLGFSVGLVFYDFPGTTVPRTTEFYWGLSLDAPLSPSVTFNHDIDEADGLYVSVGIGHSIELGEESPVAIDLSASYGWGDRSYNQYYWGLSDDSANDIALSAAIPFEIGGWSINPSINYVALASSDIKNTNAYGTDNDLFYVGIGFSKGF
jgi:hypothetical protein